MKRRMRCLRSVSWVTALPSIPRAIRCMRLAMARLCRSLTSKHAVALRAENGAEILLHVGIDTVALGGNGFDALVQPGARVSRRAAAVEVRSRCARARREEFDHADADYQWRPVRGRQRVCGVAVEVGDALFDVVATGTNVAAASAGGSQEQTLSFVVPLEHGVHARPAALIANFAKTQVRGDYRFGAWPQRECQKRGVADGAGREARR